MAITINGTTATRITLNNTALSSVTLNGTAIFPGSAVETMQDYVFPNESKHCYMFNNTVVTYGVSFSATGTWQNYPAWRTMDNDASTYWADFNSPDVITITMPFGIQLNSVTVKNRTGKNAGATYGYIFISTSTSGESDWQQYAAFQGSRTGAAGEVTTFNNSSLASLTNVRRIRVRGDVWASTDEHSIGEIVLAFKAQTSTLQAYGLL